MASLRALRLARAPARLFSSAAPAASDAGGPAVTYNAFRRRNENDDTLRARLICAFPPLTPPSLPATHIAKD